MIPQTGGSCGISGVCGVCGVSLEALTRGKKVSWVKLYFLNVEGMKDTPQTPQTGFSLPTGGTATLERHGNAADVNARDGALCVSLLLQHGVSNDEIIHSLSPLGLLGQVAWLIGGMP